MERIKEAIRLAKKQRNGETHVAAPMASRAAAGPAAPAEDAKYPMLRTDADHLEANRIITSQSPNPFSATFDMLRTKVLQEMDQNGWQVLIITSPSGGCGKSVSAINLALSIARQSERSIYLVDLDLRRPRIAQDLGVTPERDISSILHNGSSFMEAAFHVDISQPRLSIIAANQPVKQPVEAIVSRPMHSMFEQLRELKTRPIILVDMPPVLMSDDVLAFLPQADCCILAVAEGVSTVREIETSKKLLAGTNFIGCILTKSNERVQAYY
jgi:protein-tyrosine kinase